MIWCIKTYIIIYVKIQKNKIHYDNSDSPGVTYSITMTSKWARLRLKSPASRLFTEPFIQDTDQRKHAASLAFVWEFHR